MEITRTSPLTGKVHTLELDITEAQIWDYWNGALLQNAFPNLSPGEREFFKTGITDQEWDEAFGRYEDDELAEIE